VGLVRHELRLGKVGSVELAGLDPCDEGVPLLSSEHVGFFGPILGVAKGHLTIGKKTCLYAVPSATLRADLVNNHFFHLSITFRVMHAAHANSAEIFWIDFAGSKLRRVSSSNQR
jgi:hypothetical protein